MELRGYAVRVVDICHAGELQEQIQVAYRDHLLDEGLWNEYLSRFVFTPPEALHLPRSIIVVAVRQPQMRFTFHWHEKLVNVIAPPTYLHWRRTDREVQECLADTLSIGGYNVAPAILPKKLLAVRSGLASYGRNNITYVEGMGSFHRISVFYSDMPAGKGSSWREQQVLGRCNSCRMCINSCPTGAIDEGRFLLRAERCITFHNEKSGSVPFPSWIESAWHNSLLGCMRCQLDCPENRAQKTWIEDAVEFSMDETALLVAGTLRDALPPALLSKLEASDLLDSLDILSRNLTILLNREDKSCY